MSRDFMDCGWTWTKKDGGFFCKRKKWHLNEADRGTGLCPCQFWVKRLIPPVKKPKKGIKSDQKGELL